MADTELPGGSTPETPKPDNAAFAKMRVDLDNERKARQDAEARLQDIERSKLEEAERLRLEVADRDKRIGELHSIRDEHGKLSATMEKLYKEELLTVPEEKRATVEAAVSAIGTPAERLESLRSIKQLMGTPEPQIAGSVTRPTGGTPGATPAKQEGEQAKPRTLTEIKQLSWSGAAAARANRQPPSEAQT
jgi:DNA repair exonuclease SbcCD ATPase subunit